jgi:hypothetical protein
LAGTRRGGSRRSRSTVMCPCRRGMCSTPACFTVCGVTVRFDGRAASGAGTVGAGSARWSASTSGRPRPTPGRWPATLPWPKIPKQPAKNLERSPYWLPRNRIVAWATLRLAQRACRRSTRPDASVAEMQCKSGRPALGSSRPRLRTPASAGHPSQSSTGRDSIGSCWWKGRLRLLLLVGVMLVFWRRVSCSGEGCAVRVKVAPEVPLFR